MYVYPADTATEPGHPKEFHSLLVLTFVFVQDWFMWKSKVYTCTSASMYHCDEIHVYTQVYGIEKEKQNWLGKNEDVVQKFVVHHKIMYRI